MELIQQFLLYDSDIAQCATLNQAIQLSFAADDSSQSPIGNLSFC